MPPITCHLPPDLPIPCCFPLLALVPPPPTLLAPPLVTLLVLFLVVDFMAKILVKAKTMNVINVSSLLYILFLYLNLTFISQGQLLSNKPILLHIITLHS